MSKVWFEVQHEGEVWVRNTLINLTPDEAKYIFNELCDRGELYEK